MKEKTLNRNFIFLIIGQASSMFGTTLLKFTSSLLILDLTSSATSFGIITAIGYLPPVFLSPIGGIIADRSNKRNLMIALDGLYGIMAVLLVFSLSFCKRQLSRRIKRPPSQCAGNEMAVGISIMVLEFYIPGVRSPGGKIPPRLHPSGSA